MHRMRLTISHNPADPADDLRYAARVRRDLWAHSPVEVDPNGPSHGTHRDTHRNAYFEFATDYPDEVDRVLNDFGHRTRVSVQVAPTEVGPECVNCGNIAGPPNWTECPVCGFRDIAPCPQCDREVARQAYQPEGGDLFRCPACRQRVRLLFHDPLFNDRGEYNQPLVLVERAGS